jgi:hypothetical protein
MTVLSKEDSNIFSRSNFLIVCSSPSGHINVYLYVFLFSCSMCMKTHDGSIPRLRSPTSSLKFIFSQVNSELEQATKLCA